MKSNVNVILKNEQYYHGAIASELDDNVLKEVCSDIDSLQLMENIVELTSNKRNSPPILLPKEENGFFNRGTQPYYFCKNEKDALQILSCKLDFFMLATQEKSTEIPVKICIYNTHQEAMSWSTKEEISSFEDLLKALFHIPKPLLNKKESAGISLNTRSFLKESVLINYHDEYFKAEKKNVYFRLVWSEFEEKVTGCFSVGSFITRKYGD